MSLYLTRAHKSYLEYKSSREKRKQQYREELEQFSFPYLVALGKEINEARDAGHKIDEIMLAFGLKNRNFLYDALNAYLDTEKKDLPELPEIEEEPGISVSISKLSDTKVLVMFDYGNEGENFHLQVNRHGQIIDMPESWLRDLTPEKKAAVMEAVKKTQELF